ncbi:haloacid dehalogenase type II [Paraburkholderia sp. LEh10]|uniref:haloacid dehalogenase type II n=1 Tax=Paraburkholderia sp. LEh10 TaxID=2821353 RepID=UPI001AE21ADC|nr:haloacid dehalogenase type II [Paraburkholderia sp. LEh10]MBP0588592.1 haloacid dehalogenase type II [Paraburkholderia sp. LEh10]
MSLDSTRRPTWLTFDCYGTLIQWDEGLQDAVAAILAGKHAAAIDPRALIAVYDRHEHALEQTPPHRSFREVAGEALRIALEEFRLRAGPDDIRMLTERISAMPPFPEVVSTLRALKEAGFRLCIVSNTDDDVIAGNVAQLGGHIDRVITAQQAGAYKPDRRLFDYAHEQLGVSRDDVVHICASPHLDHAAARDVGFRCVWIDRGTGRQCLPDYTPDATLPTLDRVPPLFASLGW